MTQDQGQDRDWLYPRGDRPLCSVCRKQRVYLAGLCGDCYASENDRHRTAAGKRWGDADPTISESEMRLLDGNR